MYLLSMSPVQLPLHPVERVKEAFGGHSRAEQQQAEHVPVEHVPEGGIGTLDAELNGLCLQFLGDGLS